ncbi:ABC transporter permease subunit [Paenibacillus qinlingensis]|uniref:Aldouronate transport system permease protein n=1 Tax=Paenibacillus qinlingensis TaxID=1837343 RepID=A0ABU1NZL0_9BACL|nr:ABC transporter permease subunit [Paenibacillus qinlingensis]MDR6552908.1 putative aldouronate transport system permease protein [Paenibacillus qinlingensis]
METTTNLVEHRQVRKRSNLWDRITYHKYFYLMLLPIITWYVIFCYIPMYGLSLAFKTYDFSKGITGSPWIGIQNFRDILNDSQYVNSLMNTIIISFGKLIFHFPVPILLALLINQIARQKLKKIYQTIFTFPHFISWVVLGGIITNILGSQGVFNQIMGLFGFESMSILTDPALFRPLIYITHIWKEIGWDSIIYLAALAGINPELYEAADMDGANGLQKVLHVSWPGIKSTVAILFILTVGLMMNVSFDQIYNLYSAPVYIVGDTVDTYILRTTMSVGSNFGLLAAAGFIKSVASMFLLLFANYVVKKFGEQGLF